MNEKNNLVKFTTNYIRKSWLSIFQQKNYHWLAAASLIPENDPSLLWINSGVATLKKYFNNPSLALARNLVNCQRVIRTDDLANINANSYHQTLFEMLGNFSIGSNFKQEIIPIVWEWFTSSQWLGIDPSRLFITVWENDKVSCRVWKKQLVKDTHILFGDKKTNFWDMGDGPCGANTEIYYDLHLNGEIPKKIEDLDNKRFIEICNIVFPEFYHKGNDYLLLAEKCVDTGAGLERIAMVLQEKKNAFEIDLWEPVVELINNYNKEKNFEENKGNYYVIVDHLRTTIFALADGADFEPKGRGYILKKLVKKATLFAYLLNLNSDNLQNIIQKLIEINSSYYTHLKEKQELIIDKLQKEINRTLEFISKSTLILDNYFSPKITAQEIFFWYDTKGMPLELIRFYLKNKNYEFPEEEFNKLLDQQKEKGFQDRKKKRVEVF